MAKAYEIYQQTMSDITGWNDYIKFENIDYANTKAFEAIEEYYQKKYQMSLPNATDEYTKKMKADYDENKEFYDHILSQLKITKSN
jgi:hypothetical protein